MSDQFCVGGLYLTTKKEGLGVTLKSHGPQPPTHRLIYNNLPIQQEIDRVQIANSVTAETYDK